MDIFFVNWTAMNGPILHLYSLEAMHRFFPLEVPPAWFTINSFMVSKLTEVSKQIFCSPWASTELETAHPQDSTQCFFGFAFFFPPHANLVVNASGISSGNSHILDRMNAWNSLKNEWKTLQINVSTFWLVLFLFFF